MTPEDPYPFGTALYEQVCMNLRKLDLDEAGHVGELFKDSSIPADESNPCAFVLSKNELLTIRIRGEFDLSASGLIRDRKLGTIGLLQLVPERQDLPTHEREKSFRQWIRKRVDEATYLRHLLVDATRSDGPESDVVPFTVELVFILLNDDSQFRTLAGAEFGELMRETTFLHAIGVNLWLGPLDDVTHQSRAFSWLLRHTRSWLCKTNTRGGQLPALRAIKLDGFRLPGSRRLKLAPDETLHVIHGHNGTGKSSIVEALELVVTGKLERIEQRRRERNAAESYRQILTNRNRPGGSPAKITLEFEESTSVSEEAHQIQERVLAENGIDCPLQPFLKADALRMDQRLADRLAAGSAVERAKLFLEAFFFDDNTKLDEARRAQAEFNTQFQQLPASLQSVLAKSSNLEETLLSEFAWVANEEIPWPEVCKIIPFSKEQRSALAPLVPSRFNALLNDTGTFSWEQTLIRASEVDDVIDDLRALAGRSGQALEDALGILKTLGSIRVEESPRSNRALPDLMNEWLELTALTEILEREQEVFSIIEAAQKAGYSFRADYNPMLSEVVAQRAGPQASVDELRKLRDDAMKSLMGHTLQAERGQAGTWSVPTLSQFKLEALDEVAELGAFGEEFKKCVPALSEAIRIAFEGISVVKVRGGSRLLNVGSSGWGIELQSALSGVIDAVDAIRRELADPGWRRVSDLLPLLRQVWIAADRLSKSDRSVAKSFTALVADGGPFSRAINEVLALLTTARWAYEDLRVNVSLESAKQEFEVAMGDSIPARLRLNTAELNTFALAFFLLCARRVLSNPLRLLVLDDPLQNMDEFTVTTVARGLAKLLRLWESLDRDHIAAPWRVLLLLHGEEDVERIRAESPCAVYALPWLSPDQGLTDSPVEHIIVQEPSRFRKEIQTTEELVAAATDVLRVHPSV